jgi:glycosyltransferase involved in cell wall biosynthesis
MTKRKLFIMADAACTTGFAQVSHNLIYNLLDKWEIVCLAINYKGDYHPLQKLVKLYCPNAKILDDYYGFSRIKRLVLEERPDVVLVINDPWVAIEHVEAFQNINEKIEEKYHDHSAKILYTPVDAKHVKESWVKPLNYFDRVIAYTDFGKNELIESGLETQCDVLPHGVDTNVFYPIDKRDARQQARLGVDWFIVQTVARNSMRKRLDLSLYYFSLFAKDKPDNVKWYYHGILNDIGYDLMDLANHWGVRDRIIISPQNVMSSDRGLPEESMRTVYNIADVHMSTSGGEGWQLPVHESMACRVANIVPNHSALSEWCQGGVEYLELSNIPLVTDRQQNTIHAQVTPESTVAALNKLYYDQQYRKDLARKGYKLATQDKFKWTTIANQFDAIFNEVLEHGT